MKNTKRIDIIQRSESVSRYINEGSPNTAKIVEDFNSQHLQDQKLITDTQTAISKENSLTGDYRNITVTAYKGIVTLEGQVATESEKMSIGDKAVAVAGFGKVENHLQVVQG